MLYFCEIIFVSKTDNSSIDTDYLGTLNISKNNKFNYTLISSELEIENIMRIF